MSNLSLYRKYRPETFIEVVGQDHIVKVLTSAIESNKTAHAYLFVGSRGTGKTSVARILAKELGCQPEDLMEIDAASNRGVDDVRALREGVRVRPFRSPIKVYLIDEVHMLTKEAFNALLKTLEEPPEHALFILATTEIHKVPETIISRCETHLFKKPTDKILSDLVTKVAKQEGFKISQSASELVAFLGDGSFRDTLGVLQKVINLSVDKKIELEEITEITGAPAKQLIRDCLVGILDNNLEQSLQALKEVERGNKDILVFLKMLMQELRLVMFAVFAPNLFTKLSDDLADYKNLAKSKNGKRLSEILRKLLESYELVNSSYSKSLPIELALIDLLGDE